MSMGLDQGVIAKGTAQRVIAQSNEYASLEKSVAGV